MIGFGFDPSEDLSSECSALCESYCDLGPTDTVPQSPASSIPETCTPQTSTEEPETSAISTPTVTEIITPAPTQTGMAGGCNTFHRVQEGDGGQKIADDYKISMANLLVWNPDVGADCRNLKYDYCVCVGRETS